MVSKRREPEPTKKTRYTKKHDESGQPIGITSVAIDSEPQSKRDTDPRGHTLGNGWNHIETSVNKEQEGSIEEELKPVGASPESCLDQIVVKDGANEVKFMLVRHSHRKVRVDISYNGSKVRPMLFAGLQSANTYWEMLKEKRK